MLEGGVECDCIENDCVRSRTTLMHRFIFKINDDDDDDGEIIYMR